MVLRALVFALLLVGCGGKGAAAAGDQHPTVDTDPLGLLPPSAVVVANLDAHGIFARGTSSEALGRLAGRLLPVASTADFQPSRDLDRVVFASYSTGAVDFAAVLSGRFDPAKLADAAQPDGTPVVRAAYADHVTYAAGHVQYVVLSSKTVLSGTLEGVRRVLDRIHDGVLQRSIPPWMVQTLETDGAQLALAADFTDHPIATAAIRVVRLDWLKSLRVARVIGNFAPPGMNVAATLTYEDAQEAQEAAAGVHVVDTWLGVLGPVLGGLRLENLETSSDAQDLRCTFALDEGAVRAALALADRFLPAVP